MADFNFRNTDESLFSAVNSTTTPLNAGETFTGVAELNNWQDVMISLKTDQNGTYYADFSPDGVNWDSTLPPFIYDTARINPPHILVKGARYFRLRFTNTSASNQTYLRINVDYGAYNKLTAPINGTLAETFDSTVVRPTDYKYEVALGRRQGATTWNKFGVNLDLDIGTEVLAAQGGTFTFLTAASTLTIVSSSSNDDGSPAGTGANSIVISGVDANRLAQTEVVTLNGTTPVVTATTWLGINRVAIYLAGSTFTNVGNITVTATTGGTVQAYVPAGKGTTQQCIFFTQDNHQLLTDWMTINAEKLSGGTQPIVQFRGWVWSAVSNAKYEVFYRVIDVSVESSHDFTPSQPFIVGENSVFWIEATSDQNNTVVSGRFSGIEVRTS